MLAQALPMTSLIALEDLIRPLAIAGPGTHPTQKAAIAAHLLGRIAESRTAPDSKKDANPWQNLGGMGGMGGPEGLGGGLGGMGNTCGIPGLPPPMPPPSGQGGRKW